MPADSNLIPAESIERRILLVRGQKVLLDFQLAELYAVPTKALNQAVKRNLERFPEDFMFRLSEAEMAEVALIPGIVVPWPVRLFSCGAAAESSPRREPWVSDILDQAPAGAADSECASVAPAGACPSRVGRTHGSRRGLLSFAPPALETEQNTAARPWAFTEHGVALLSGLLHGQRIARTTVSILRAFAQLTKREELAADAQSAMNEIRAWLETGLFRLETAWTPPHPSGQGARPVRGPGLQPVGRVPSPGARPLSINAGYRERLFAEAPRSPWLLPTAPRRDCAPRFQSHFATRKSILP